MTPRAAITEILTEAASHHDVTVADLLSVRRTKAISLARHRAMYRLRSLQRPNGTTRYTLDQIATFVGVTDHASVIYGLRRYKEYLADAGVDNTIAADEWAVDIHTATEVIPVHVAGSEQASDCGRVNS